MMSVMLLTSCRSVPVSKQPVFCPSSAFIDEKDYELGELETNSDKEFHKWAAVMASKYPNLKNAYSDLRECWDYYHGSNKK